VDAFQTWADDLSVHDLPRIVSALAVLLVGFLAAHWLARGVRRWGSRGGVDPTLIQVLQRLVRALVMTMALAIALARLGVEATSIMALLGTAGLAIGLAVKDTLADVASGLVLVILRPFGVGDFVSIGGLEGTVTGLGTFETRIVTVEGVPVTIPNSHVRTREIRNFARAATRRIELVFAIGYDRDADRALAALRGVVAACEDVLPEPAPEVRIHQYAEQAVQLVVRCHVEPPRLQDARHGLLAAARAALAEAGAPLLPWGPPR
jgi:small conductance mechanosensitive channel